MRPGGRTGNQSGYDRAFAFSSRVTIYRRHYRLLIDFLPSHKVLELSPGIDEPNGLRWPLVLCHVIGWTMVALVLIKGIRSAGKVGKHVRSHHKGRRTRSNLFRIGKI
jgi:hypothetical protein